MKVIIAGSRVFNDYGLLCQAVVDSGFDITEVVSGCARGADTLGERWAADHGVPVARFAAEWDKYQRAAGPIRNRQMAEYAEGLIALPVGEARGTRDMIRQATKLKLKVFVKEASCSTSELN